MSDQENEGFTSGDPLSGGPPAPPPPPGAPPPAPAPAAPPAGPEAPATAPPPGYYTTPPPPGAMPGGFAPTSPPPFQAGIQGRYVLSGWWRRVGAAVIDGLIITVGAIIILVIFGSVFSAGFFAAGEEDAGAVALIASFLLSAVAIAIVALAYAPVLMARTNGKTLGRMATGIRVVRANGQPMTLAWAALREVAVKSLLVGVASSVTFGLAYLLDVLWPLWDDENRALHDFVVDTRTVLD